MTKNNRYIVYPLVLLLGFLIGCSASKYEEKEKKEEIEVEVKPGEEQGLLIMNTAKEEQKNEMYSPEKDSTYLYWLDNRLIILYNTTKCNIYVLNTLYKAGFKCPDVNTLTKDLMDETRFTDIFPVVDISSPEEIMKGDLIVWYGHVILFDYLINTKNKIYAQAWWSGTSQEDNNDNIINNVKYGKYSLKGNYIVRRPIKR